MEKIVELLIEHMSQNVNSEIIIFIISMIPVLELRGGLLAAAYLKVPLYNAIPICIIGNIIPIPFILLFICKIFDFLRKKTKLGKFIDKIENKALEKSEKIQKYEILGLVLFVGIPLPGTGAWTGSLIAALLKLDIKKSIFAEFLGIIIATIIMSIVSYGLLGLIL